MPFKPSAAPASCMAGFTLLEVLVAFAIAAPALILLFGQGASSVSAAKTSALYQEAIARAKSRLETLTEQTLQPSDRNGDDGGGFHWRARVVALGSAPAPSPPPRGGYAAGTALFDVTVDISWPSEGGARHITLNTRRLGPASGDAP